MEQSMILFEPESIFKDQMAGTPEKCQAFCGQKGRCFGVG